jgi:hypothetical protein
LIKPSISSVRSFGPDQYRKKEIQRPSEKAGIRPRMLWRAKQQLGLGSYKPAASVKGLMDRVARTAAKSPNMTNKLKRAAFACFGIGRYGPNSSALRDTSQALVTAPIVDLCSYPGFCPSNQLPSGSGVMLQVVGFALIFIEDADKTNGVTGRLINVSSCDSVGPAISGGTTGAGIPLRLVHLP